MQVKFKLFYHSQLAFTILLLKSRNFLHNYCEIFDSCKQSLNQLLLPSTHPPIQHQIFCTKNEHMLICCINGLLFHAIIQDLKANVQNFQLLTFFKLTKVFKHKCPKFSTSIFTTQMLKYLNFNFYYYYEFFPLLETTKF